MAPLLTSLTEAVADGREPDWSSLDLSSLSDEERVQIAELRAVFDIGRCLATLSSGAHLATPISSSDEAAAIPTTWGPLEVRERVGRGRFGDVYRAWDPAVARPVALKLLRLDHNAGAADRVVVDEGRLMGRVRHLNVATIYGAAHHDGRTGLWMEFIEGRTLEAELTERGPLPADDAAAIGVELCRALAAVHAAGLVHRDVKAQNVMREPTGRIVLGDFGTGLELDEHDLGPQALAGTPVYLAPEVLNRQPATPQSDIYSLGVLLFHLVTRSFPVRGRSIGEIRERHARGDRTRLDAIAPALPPAFVHLVERAQSPQPSDRFATAADMERALVAAATPAADPSAPPAIGERSRRWSPSRLAIAAAVAVITGAVTYSAWQAGALGLVGRGSVAERAAAAVPTGRRLNRVPAPDDSQFWGRPSPDGRLYTFVDMNGDLGVFDTATGDERILTDLKHSGGWAFGSSTFSADGLRIAFAWGAADGTRELRIVNTAGGLSRLLRSDRDEVAHPIDWSADGEHILARLERHDGSLQLALISVATGEVRRLEVLDGSHGTASLSPDGRYVVFDAAQQRDATERDVFVRTIDGPDPPVAIGAASSDDFGPLWTPDGDHVLFVSDRTGEPSVWAVQLENGRPAGEPILLQRNIGRVTPYGLTTAGTLFYTLQVGIVDVFVAAIDVEHSRLETPRPLAPSQVGSKASADWSPDGRYVAYVLLPHGGSGANRTRRLIILEPSTGERRVLNPALSQYSSPQWSRDGRQILVTGIDRERRRGLYLIDAVSGRVGAAAVVGGSTPQEIGGVAWGPDPHTLLYARNGVGVVSLDLESGREHLRFRFADEGIERLTNGMSLGMSPDGRTLAYSAHRRLADGRMETLLRVKPADGPTRDLWVGNVLFDSWTPHGEILFTQYSPDWQSQMMSLWAVSPAGGPPRSFGVEIHGLRNIRMHPDGRQIVLTSGFPGNELWALENFLPGRQ